MPPRHWMPSWASELLAVAHAGLGHGHRHVAPLVFLGDGGRREVGRGPGRLDGHVHVGQLVLDGLERTDLHAELLALLHVGVDDVEDRLAGAHHLGRQCHRRLLAQPGAGRRRARPASPSTRSGVDPHAVQRDGGVLATGVERRPWARCRPTRRAPRTTRCRRRRSSLGAGPPPRSRRPRRRRRRSASPRRARSRHRRGAARAVDAGGGRTSRTPRPRPGCRRSPRRHRAEKRAALGVIAGARAGPARTAWRWRGTAPGR